MAVLTGMVTGAMVLSSFAEQKHDENKTRTELTNDGIGNSDEWSYKGAFYCKAEGYSMRTIGLWTRHSYDKSDKNIYWTNLTGSNNCPNCVSYFKFGVNWGYVRKDNRGYYAEDFQGTSVRWYIELEGSVDPWFY